MRAAIAAMALGACSFGADYSGTHYTCDPRAPSCPPGQTCSTDGTCVGPGRGDPPDAAPASSPDAAVQGVTRDTWIDVADPATNHGYDTICAFDADTTKYAFLRFVLTGAPAGARVDSAELVLYVDDPLEDGDAIIKPVTSSWNEDAMNYALRDSTDPWLAPGGDVGAIVQSWDPRTIDQTYTIVLPPNLVQGWLDNPSSNFGVRFESSSTTGRGAQWNTRENDAKDTRPLLRLTLTE